jgi:hypothetical protein
MAQYLTPDRHTVAVIPDSSHDVNKRQRVLGGDNDVNMGHGILSSNNEANVRQGTRGDNNDLNMGHNILLSDHDINMSQGTPGKGDNVNIHRRTLGSPHETSTLQGTFLLSPRHYYSDQYLTDVLMQTLSQGCIWPFAVIRQCNKGKPPPVPVEEPSSGQCTMKFSQLYAT